MFSQSHLSLKQVITTEMIRHAGLLRVGEILRLADGWRISTIDGFTWQASPEGLSAFENQNWKVLVNGQRMDFALFNMINLNLLPISIDQIDSVEIFSTPQLHDGEFTDQGLIHIHTTKPQNGLSLKVRSWFGNETGDPGPYIFTEYASENIDRSGPDYSAYIDYSAGKWYMRASITDHNHYSTDRTIRQRNPSRTNQFLWTQVISPALRLGVKTERGGHELFLGHSTNADLYSYKLSGASPLFFSPYGGELFAKREFTHAGFAGSFILLPNWELAYRLHQSGNLFDQHPHNKEGVEFDWKMNQFNVNVESQFTGDSFRGMIGTGWNRTKAKTSYDLTGGDITFSKIYGNAEYRYFKNVRHSLAVQLLLCGARAAFKSNASTKWSFLSRHDLTIHLAYAERLSEENNSLWFWSERGYGVLNNLGIPYRVMGGLGTSTQFTSDLIWKYTFHQKKSLSIGGYHRTFRNLAFEEQAFHYNPASQSFYSPALIYTDVEGSVVGVRLMFEGSIVPGLRQRFSYSYQTVIGGDARFRNTQETLPESEIRYRIHFQPVENFSLGAAVNYRSSTRWRDYRFIDEETGGQFSSRLKRVWITDFTAEKYIWNRRIRSNLVMRNLFGGRQQFHPLGAHFDLQFYVQFELYFQSI